MRTITFFKPVQPLSERLSFKIAEENVKFILQVVGSGGATNWGVNFLLDRITDDQPIKYWISNGSALFMFSIAGIVYAYNKWSDYSKPNIDAAIFKEMQRLHKKLPASNNDSLLQKIELLFSYKRELSHTKKTELLFMLQTNNAAANLNLEEIITKLDEILLPFNLYQYSPV